MRLAELCLIIAAVLFFLAGLRGDALIGWGLMFIALSMLAGPRTTEWLGTRLGRGPGSR